MNHGTLVEMKRTWGLPLVRVFKSCSWSSFNLLSSHTKLVVFSMFVDDLKSLGEHWTKMPSSQSRVGHIVVQCPVCKVSQKF